jgi:hypothetical protein
MLLSNCRKLCSKPLGSPHGTLSERLAFAFGHVVAGLCIHGAVNQYQLLNLAVDPGIDHRKVEQRYLMFRHIGGLKLP